METFHPTKQEGRSLLCPPTPTPPPQRSQLSDALNDAPSTSISRSKVDFLSLVLAQRYIYQKTGLFKEDNIFCNTVFFLLYYLQHLIFSSFSPCLTHPSQNHSKSVRREEGGKKFSPSIPSSLRHQNRVGGISTTTSSSSTNWGGDQRSKGVKKQEWKGKRRCKKSGELLYDA